MQYRCTCSHLFQTACRGMPMYESRPQRRCVRQNVPRFRRTRRMTTVTFAASFLCRTFHTKPSKNTCSPNIPFLIAMAGMGCVARTHAHVASFQPVPKRARDVPGPVAVTSYVLLYHTARIVMLDSEIIPNSIVMSGRLGADRHRLNTIPRRGQH